MQFRKQYDQERLQKKCGLKEKCPVNSRGNAAGALNLILRQGQMKQ